MYYYLKGVKVEIYKLIESNKFNILDILILKNVYLQQDYIISPLPRNNKKFSKSNKKSIAFIVSSIRGRYNYWDEYTYRDILNKWGSHNTNK